MPSKLIISPAVREKLSQKSPPVTIDEIIQCFANQTHHPLIDSREQHLTNPYTRWIVSETDYGRRLKVMYIPAVDGVRIKSAYDASPQIVTIYYANAKQF